jgi:hypothetical protein
MKAVLTITHEEVGKAILAHIGATTGFSPSGVRLKLEVRDVGDQREVDVEPRRQPQPPPGQYFVEGGTR